jgi:hypothetical protein
MASYAIRKEYRLGSMQSCNSKFYRQRIWIGINAELQQQILQALHTSALGGHSSFPVTYRKLKQLFARQGMKAATHSFVQACLTCQQAKPKSRVPRVIGPTAYARRSLAGNFYGLYRRIAQVWISKLHSCCG